MAPRVQLEPEARAFAEATAKPPFLFELAPEIGRTAFDAFQFGSVKKLPVNIEDLVIEGSPSGKVSIRILRPKSAPATLPVIVFIHGAGWVFGSLHTHDRLIRELGVRARAVVVFPNYSLSPEARYPIAIEECYAVLKWVAQHGVEHGMDPKKLAVAGDGAGGNMAAAITLMSKERGGPPIRLQLLFYPVTDCSFDTESYQQFAEGYYLRRDIMMWFWNQYHNNFNERKEVTAAPLRASIEQLRRLPQALIITGEADVLRDEGEAYANRLREAGVRVTAARFQGIIHDFVMLNPLANTAATRGAILLATAWLREGFKGQI